MSSKNPSCPVAHAGVSSYDKVSQCLHWLTLLFVLAMFATGWMRNDFPPDWRPAILPVHINCGMAILLLTLVRLLWRPVRRAPAAAQAGFMGLTAKAAHLLLYAVLIALPLCGWLMISAQGREGEILNLFTLPPLLLKDRATAHWLKEAHEYMAYGFAGLIGLHASAAIFHHAYLKDDTLTRMLPGRTRKRPSLRATALQ